MPVAAHWQLFVLSEIETSLNNLFLSFYALFRQIIWLFRLKTVPLHPIDPATASRPQGM